MCYNTQKTKIAVSAKVLPTAPWTEQRSIGTLDSASDSTMLDWYHGQRQVLKLSPTMELHYQGQHQFLALSTTDSATEGSGSYRQTGASCLLAVRLWRLLCIHMRTHRLAY
ncbi:hypothetical protein NQZ68_011410 [Dissostichus eleginoides]|nr:hypothetical protein NQZ68_011410 [Dissostichus eleginoides]